MRYYYVTIKLLLLICIGNTTYANSNIVVEVAYNKVTHLVFDSDIKEWNCGNEDVLVQKSGHTLRLQAAVDRFEETNIFIETVNHEYYNFVVQYNSSPAKTFYHISKTDADYIEKQQKLV